MVLPLEKLSTDSLENQDEKPFIYGRKEIERFCDARESLTINKTGSLDENFPQNNIGVLATDYKQRHSISHSLVAEQWEGYIKEVKGTIFIAELTKKNCQGAEIIEGEFEIYDVPEDERHLIQNGVVFYWVIGKEVKKSGMITNNECIIFRRMPSWKKFDINATSHITDEFFKALSGQSSC